ncbi:Pycsar system effector family protein [Flavobacterium sp.]|uniref:Pycsar system effector family protein n=1 Tax=Flavobacterium sp. TaxID=239 RepID=UPI0026229104|nr:Pycsar system effector family protein [Flavobacterium sp.]
MEVTNPHDKATSSEISTENDKGKKKNKVPKTERGIDTMFRTTLNNHNNLSGLVDNKANILLSVNAIIISVSLTTIIPKLDNPSNAHLIIPTLILIVSSVIAITFAILATRPTITGGSFTRKEVYEKKVNLLFFGNFYKMSYEDYSWAMNELIKDKDYVYNSMIKDLYHLGIVLEKKYRLLRIAYTIFMFGIIISVIAFLIAFQSR